MAGRILVIRGGAIGDFVLTLPAIGLLREAFPETHLEILGYRHIVAIAEGRHYANATRSIEYAGLAGFFNPKSELDPELSEYFASFNQVISYLYDPDGFFEGNLRRAGVKNLLVGDPRITDQAHASVQLARPLEALALYLESPVSKLFPSPEDLEAATSWPENAIAIHIGSGSPRKNWPAERWASLIDAFPATHPILVIAGESDAESLAAVRRISTKSNVHFLENLPLPVLAAVLSRSRLFLGHDSGISHIAAATGVPCVLLFGPTDPAIWAPAGDHVRILRSESRKLHDIELESVRRIADSLLHDE